MKKGFKLNILDITLISAVVLIIVTSIITVWRDKTADKISITVWLLSDEYAPEVFDGIENGTEVYNSKSGKLIGIVNNVRTVGDQTETYKIEIEVSAEAEDFKNGAVIDKDRYYMGDRLSVNAKNSRIVMMVKELGVRD